MEQYQALRAMLSDIIARCPEGHTERRQRLGTAGRRVMGMENLVGEHINRVGEHINRSIGDTERGNLNRELNEIQSDLEELASDLGFGDPQDGVK
jgi:hypothetical protein